MEGYLKINIFHQGQHMYCLAQNEHECKKCMCIIWLWIYSSNDLGNILETVLYQSLVRNTCQSKYFPKSIELTVIIKLTKRSYVQNKYETAIQHEHLPRIWLLQMQQVVKFTLNIEKISKLISSCVHMYFIAMSRTRTECIHLRKQARIHCFLTNNSSRGPAEAEPPILVWISQRQGWGSGALHRAAPSRLVSCVPRRPAGSGPSTRCWISRSFMCSSCLWPCAGPRALRVAAPRCRR